MFNILFHRIGAGQNNVNVRKNYWENSNSIFTVEKIHDSLSKLQKHKIAINGCVCLFLAEISYHFLLQF